MNKNPPYQGAVSDRIANRVILENSTVRVWELILAPGEATEWHQHKHDYMFVVMQNGRVQTEYVDGTIEKQNDVVGAFSYRTVDQAHRLLNTDTKTYVNLVIEFLAT